MQLNDNDKKHWAPIESVVKYIADKIPEGAKVLEIGPGFVPFPKASKFVDYKAGLPVPQDKLVSVDMNEAHLPFADKEWDFIYCRHVIEDMYNPFLLLREMQRIGKAGYIETPSPIAELGRGVDGSSPPFRGYHHHRNMIWLYENQLRIIGKYPIVEYIRFSEEDIMKWLRKGPQLWNTYYLWENEIKWKHIQNGPDFTLTRDYSTILKNAMDQAEMACNMFWRDVPQSEISSLPQHKQKVA